MNAIVPGFEIATSGDNLELRANVVYFGVGVKDLSPIAVVILPSDTIVQIKQKIIDAVIAEAVNLGWTLLANQILLPVFQKGG